MKDEEETTNASNVPGHLRFLLPFFVAADVALLLCGHLCIGSIVRLEGYAPFDKIKSHDVSEANLVHAAQELAAAHAWVAVFVVAAVSGIWPYVKLFLTLVTVRQVDLGSIDKETGQIALTHLAAAGKWSFADIFLIAVNILIFDISTDEYKVAVFFKLKVDIFVKLRFGAFALTAALTLSTLLTHWAAAALRDPIPSAEEFADTLQPTPELEPLLPALNGADASGARRSIWRPREHLQATLVAAAALICFLCGVMLPLIHINREGFLGNLIRQGKDLDLSVITIAQGLQHLAEMREQPLLQVFTVVFLAFTCALPLLELVLLTTSLTLAACQQPRLSFNFRNSAEFCSELACSDVLLLIIIITATQLRTIVEYNLQDECADMRSFIDGGPAITISGLGMAADKDCLRLVPILRNGWWLLLISMLLRCDAWRRSGVITRKLRLLARGEAAPAAVG